MGEEGLDMQYDLFQDDEIEAIYIELDNLRLSVDKLRKSLFYRHTELKRTVEALQSEVDHVKQIYSGKKAELVPFFGEYIEVIK